MLRIVYTLQKIIALASKNKILKQDTKNIKKLKLPLVQDSNPDYMKIKIPHLFYGTLGAP